VKSESDGFRIEGGRDRRSAVPVVGCAPAPNPLRFAEGAPRGSPAPIRSPLRRRRSRTSADPALPLEKFRETGRPSECGSLGFLPTGGGLPLRGIGDPQGSSRDLRKRFPPSEPTLISVGRDVRCRPAEDSSAEPEHGTRDGVSEKGDKESEFVEQRHEDKDENELNQGHEWAVSP